MGPPCVDEVGSRFHGKSNPLQTRFFFLLTRSLSGTLRRTTYERKKLPKAKMEKQENLLRSKATDRQKAFKIQFVSRLVFA